MISYYWEEKWLFELQYDFYDFKMQIWVLNASGNALMKYVIPNSSYISLKTIKLRKNVCVKAETISQFEIFV